MLQSLQEYIACLLPCLLADKMTGIADKINEGGTWCLGYGIPISRLQRTWFSIGLKTYGGFYEY